jgi:hypothetical protein
MLISNCSYKIPSSYKNTKLVLPFGIDLFQRTIKLKAYLE